MTGFATRGAPVRRHGGRRAAIRACAAALGACLVLAGAVRCGSGDAEPPNVLIVVLDTTRGDRSTTNGYARPTTPRIAELAKDGVTFTDAWSPSSWTVPAHAAMFTGIVPGRLRILGAIHAQLYAESVTLAERLVEDGWATASFSCNPYVSPAFGLTQGFRTAESYGALDAGSEPQSRLASRRALAWMRAQSHASRRFLAFVNVMEPHAPYEPPADAARRFLREGTPPDALDAARKLSFPRTLKVGIGGEELPPAALAAASDLYDAEISVADAEIGTLLDGLRESGLLDRTLVIVCSDHGEGLGEHGWVEHAVFLHRTLLHVPLVARLPGTFDGGRVVRDVVRLEDVFPTVLRACGLTVPDGIDGVALQSGLAGRIARAAEKASPDWCERAAKAVDARFGEIVGRARRSVYDGRFHLIVDSAGETDLFDVTADPGETDDLAERDPVNLERMRMLLPPPVE